MSIEKLGWLKQDIDSWYITKDIQKYSDKEELKAKMVKSLALTNKVVVPDVSQSTIENIIDASC